MRILNWIIKLLVFCSSLSFAGDLTNIYKEYLPEQIILKNPQLTGLESLLNIYGRIDPNLIYIYLSHLDLKINKNITDGNKNYGTYLQQAYNKARQAHIVGLMSR